jgi:sigma-B regulation protein RsbU (phosphoserine phosphatase)
MALEPGTLLVVDDDEPNRDMLSRRLARKGYHVAVSADGPAALAQVAQQHFDLVLLDVMMPGISGLEVLKVLRQQYLATELPVIMVTARDQSEDIVTALQLGANDYVTKPLDFPVVLARIETQILLKRSVEEAVRLRQDLAERNQALERTNARLTQVNRRMEHDLRTAARIQAALLPRRVPSYPAARFSWHFQPCDELAGDSLNVVALDDRRVGLYVLDVSGHGVAAALLSVTLSRMLSSPADPSSVLVRACDDNDLPGPDTRSDTGMRGLSVPVLPAEVANELSRRFPFDPATGQFFTILYGQLDVVTGEFHYVSAGHPGLAYLPAIGPPRIIDRPGFPIGLAPAGYETHRVGLTPGDRLYLYSDGIPEARNDADALFGAERMLQCLERGRSGPLDRSITNLLDDVRTWCGGKGLHDDVSLLGVEFGPAAGATAHDAPHVTAPTPSAP